MPGFALFADEFMILATVLDHEWSLFTLGKQPNCQDATRALEIIAGRGLTGGVMP
ncbi:MAG: hypothetical protein HY868_17705 [Chloroflexi bacterium]|nr:hypothetical protein [Chloroflexota bacterium]